jgi:arginase
MKPVHIIGVPLDLGADRRGVDMGPSALRIAGLGKRLTALGYAVTDRGNLEAPVRETRHAGDPAKKYIDDIASVCHRLFDTASASLAAGALPIVLGGDHSLSAGSVAAAAAAARQRHERLGLLWIDAHADMNTPRISPSGNVHGMPLAALLGPEPSELSSIGGVSPTIDATRTVLVGVRNLDPAEREHVVSSGIHVLTMQDVDRLGMATVAVRALELAGRDTDGLHVSFDLDVCDPSIAPGVGTPVRGGISYREAHLMMETVADSGRLRALDLVELNPTLDDRNATAELGVGLVLSALGLRIL